MSYKLLETSALVLLCDKGLSYQTPLSKKFLSYLDLSSGESIYKSYSNYYPKINHVIHSRKYIVHKSCSNFLKTYGDSSQLIFLACGFDPVLIKMQELFPKNKIFGIDNEVKEVEKLTQTILPQSFISYIQSDIQDYTSMIQKLIQKGWDPSRPTGVVIEGIIYYVPPSFFWSNLLAIKKLTSSSFFICGDFLLPLDTRFISKESLEMGKFVFETIKKKCQIKDYYTCSFEDMKEKLKSLGFSQPSFYLFEDIQKERLGSSQSKEDCYLSFFSADLKK